MKEIHQVGTDIEAQREILTEENHELKQIIAVEKKGEGDELQILIHKKIEEVSEDPFEEKTIFRVPAWFHERQKGLFEPVMVSIGPYHHGKESLRFMEEQKWCFLRDFLAAGSVGIEVYLQELRALEARARRCYSEKIDMGTDDFVMMLLLDGCFLLEHLQRLSVDRLEAFCYLGWGYADIATDLRLLENQIPFFVIHKLFSIQRGQAGNCEGPCILLNLFFEYTPCKGYNTISASGPPPNVSCNNISHYLHLFHTCIVQEEHTKSNIAVYQEEQKNQETDATASECNITNQCCTALCGALGSLWREVCCTALKVISSPKTDATSQINAAPENIKLRKLYTSPIGAPCASMLHEAGVKFKRKKNPRNMFDMTFENGTMEMPFLSINYKKKRSSSRMLLHLSNAKYAPSNYLHSQLF